MNPKLLQWCLEMVASWVFLGVKDRHHYFQVIGLPLWFMRTDIFLPKTVPLWGFLICKNVVSSAAYSNCYCYCTTTLLIIFPENLPMANSLLNIFCTFLFLTAFTILFCSFPSLHFRDPLQLSHRYTSFGSGVGTWMRSLWLKSWCSWPLLFASASVRAAFWDMAVKIHAEKNGIWFHVEPWLDSQIARSFMDEVTEWKVLGERVCRAWDQHFDFYIVSP